MAQQTPNHHSNIDRWLAFSFGVIFVAALLYLATVEKNPSPVAIRVYITVLALAAGGIGAILPGFIEVRYKNILRAGGAMGLAVLVYSNEPAIGKNVVNFVEPKVSAQPVIDAFFAAIDSGDYRKSWVLLPEMARQQVSGSESVWAELYKNDIVPLGKNESRTVVGQQHAQSPSGAPPGIYKGFAYKSKYSNDRGIRLENVVVRANSVENWEIYSYQISATTIASQ